jgi:starch phosphorylase
MNTAIFVMEMGVDNRIQTYSGGLGILAADMAYSFADLDLPAVFVTLLYRGGYTLQKFDNETGQQDLENSWDYRTILSPLDEYCSVEIGSKSQKVGAWQYIVSGKRDIRILFLDTDFPENEQAVRDATDKLYGGNASHRLVQEIVLGVGGYRILASMGEKVDIYHLNESHAAFAIVDLLKELKSAELVMNRCVFTTHTPIPAGNDVFPLTQIKETFSGYPWVNWEAESIDGTINLSRLASKYCGVTNAVSVKHRYVAEKILDHKTLEYVTNGVYHRRWVHTLLGSFYDDHMPGWKDSPALLARAQVLPPEKFAETHQAVKQQLVEAVGARSRVVGFDVNALTIGLAKRWTAYKRNNLILTDPARLINLGNEKGPVQIVIAGKAHPKDDNAKRMLLDALLATERVNGETKNIRIAMLENYDIDLAKVLVSGCDVWLNNPKRPLEACGTSGMKAAMNGVVNFSVYDGWWLEGGVDGVNGWGIGRKAEWSDFSEPRNKEDLDDIYLKLENTILPTYYGNRAKWWEMAKNSVATVGPLFNSYRMVNDYVTKVYTRAARGNS